VRKLNPDESREILTHTQRRRRKENEGEGILEWEKKKKKWSAEGSEYVCLSALLRALYPHILKT
jgi:hypothetical protein